MAFANMTTVIVTAQYVMMDGSAGAGNVVFTPSSAVNDLVDAGGNQLIVPEVMRALLDSNGRISIVLPATDDPDIAPTGWTYHVQENISNRSPNGSYEYDIQVPVASAGDTVDLADLAHVSPVPDVIAYPTIAQYQALVDRVAALEAEIGGGGGTITLDGGVVT